MSVKADNLTIWMNRGNGHYIVQEGNTFYLADLYAGEAVRAYPPEKADIFLKAGMFVDTDEVTPADLRDIQEAMKNKKDHPAKIEHERRGNNGSEPRL